MATYTERTLIFNKIMGEKIGKFRLEFKWEHSDMAFKLGVTRSQYSNIEGGRSGTTPENIALLARIFRCSLHDIFPSEREISKFMPVSKTDKKKMLLEKKIAHYTKQLAEL